jgi:hypothetical protein
VCENAHIGKRRHTRARLHACVRSSTIFVVDTFKIPIDWVSIQVLSEPVLC